MFAGGEDQTAVPCNVAEHGMRGQQRQVALRGSGCQIPPCFVRDVVPNLLVIAKGNYDQAQDSTTSLS